MKYVIRKGMFETNSSSTHALTLFINNIDQEGNLFNEEDYNIKQDDEFENEYVRQIRSKKMKACLLYQFKFNTLTDGYGSLKDYFLSLSEEKPNITSSTDLVDFAKQYNEIMIFKERILEKLEQDEDAKRIMEEVEANSSRWNAACLECFWNDVLDFCTCGIDYYVICDRFHIDIDNFDDELRLIDLILDDDSVFFVAEESWYGGAFYDIPSIL